MIQKIVSACGWFSLIFAMTVMSGCANDNITPGNPTASRTNNASFQQGLYRIDERDAFSVKTDTARRRIWVLSLDDVRVYDAINKKLIRKIALPGWLVTRAFCAPDLALDSSGSAFVSSNVITKLWRIDGKSFEVKTHEISLQARDLWETGFGAHASTADRWETGFGALAFSADGTLLAFTSSGNSMWNINVTEASAGMIRLYHPPLKACATIRTQLTLAPE